MADTQIVSFALYGPPMFKGAAPGFPNLHPFRKLEERLSAQYAADVFEVGEWYKAQVMASFSLKHGRTGETAKSIRGDWFPGTTPDEVSVYAVKLGGAISYVINPIQEHEIGPSAGGGYKLAVAHTFTGERMYGRATNFYQDFGPVSRVQWYQGKPGGESHSPDRSWYEDLKPVLEVTGEKKLRGLAATVQTLWDLESVPMTKLAGNLPEIE